MDGDEFSKAIELLSKCPYIINVHVSLKWFVARYCYTKTVSLLCDVLKGVKYTFVCFKDRFVTFSAQLFGFKM